MCDITASSAFAWTFLKATCVLHLGTGALWFIKRVSLKTPGSDVYGIWLTLFLLVFKKSEHRISKCRYKIMITENEFIMTTAFTAQIVFWASFTLIICLKRAQLYFALYYSLEILDAINYLSPRWKVFINQIHIKCRIVFHSGESLSIAHWPFWAW